MIEQRINWSEIVSEETRNRAMRERQLLIALESVRNELKTVGKDLQRYDELKQEQRNITARLATL